MNNSDKDPSVEPIFGQPENATELINKYGTYEIQPTADTANPFPAIAQGLPSENVCGTHRSRKKRRDALKRNYSNNRFS